MLIDFRLVRLLGAGGVLIIADELPGDWRFRGLLLGVILLVIAIWWREPDA